MTPKTATNKSKHAPQRGRRRFLLLLAALALMLAPSHLRGEESLVARRARVDAMSPAEKDALRRRQESFVRLDADEQQRIRSLHEQLSNASRSAELLDLAKRYSDWLKTLDARQRAELLSLPAEKKIVRIKALQREQEKRRFREIISRQLSDDDLKAIFHWLDGFFRRHEDEWLAMLPREVRARFEKAADKTQRRHILGRAIIMRMHYFPHPDASEVQELLEQLSDAARKSFQAAQKINGQGQLMERWVRAAVFTRMIGNPSEKELREYLTKRLDPQTRSQLEELPPDEMRTKLKRMYSEYKFHKWSSSHGGRPSRRGPGFRPAQGPPRGGEPKRPPFGIGKETRSRGQEGNSSPPQRAHEKIGKPNNRPPRARLPDSET